MSPTGKTWSKDNFNHRVLKPAVEIAGYDRGAVTFHDLRHTFASLMIAAGTHPKVLQALMGHKDIGVTMNTYGHLYEGADQAAIDQFERFLSDPLPHECPIEGHAEQVRDAADPAWLGNGAYRDRTGDLRLAKPALSQLS